MPTSTSNVQISDVDVKEWISGCPSVDRLRPNRCPWCGTAARPIGEGLNLWGHGTRERQFFGLLSFDGSPREIILKVRRFLCTECARTCTVLPCQACPTRRYLLPTIALALAMWSLGQDPLAAVAIRRMLSPINASSTSAPRRTWPQLLRWAKADDLCSVDSAADGFLPQKRAERLTQSFASRGPPGRRGLTLQKRAYLGASGTLDEG